MHDANWKHYPYVPDWGDPAWFTFPAVDGYRRDLGVSTYFIDGFLRGSESGRSFAFIVILTDMRVLRKRLRIGFYTFALYDLASALTVQSQKRIVKKKGILMKKRTTNILLTMFLSVTASVMATAQTTQKLPPAAPTPSTKQLAPGNGAGFSMEKASADSANATTDINASSYWSNGWNYIHPTNCELYYSGGYPYLVVYAQGGGYFYTTLFVGFIGAVCGGIGGLISRAREMRQI